MPFILISNNPIKMSINYIRKPQSHCLIRHLLRQCATSRGQTEAAARIVGARGASERARVSVFNRKKRNDCARLNDRERRSDGRCSVNDVKINLYEYVAVTFTGRKVC